MQARVIKAAHEMTHFDMTSPDDDPAALLRSKTHADFKDPGITYLPKRLPDKFASVVNLHPEKTVSYSTETASRFLGRTVPRSDPILPRKSLVPLGGKCDEYMSTAHASYKKGLTSTTKPAAGAFIGVSSEGNLSNNSRTYDIIAGKRLSDDQVYQPTTFKTVVPQSVSTGNDDPIAYLPRTKFGPQHITTHEIVARANQSIPTLRSLGAVRP